jgi:invasion protein IalB
VLPALATLPTHPLMKWMTRTGGEIAERIKRKAVMRKTGWITLGFLLASALPAFAQVPQQAPQLTTATYNDWTVRCEIHDTTKTCEMEQTSQMQGQPVSQIAIGRPNKTAPLRVVFQVPINVWLPAGVTFMLDDKDPGVSATFKRCVGNGCFADADLPVQLVSKLRTQTQNGKLLFKDAAQRVVTIPVSFKGFAPAFDAMAKE